MDTYKKVIYECTHDTSTAMMEDCVNKHLDDTNKIYFNEINEIGVDEDGGQTKYIGNEDVIHRYITENEPETNQYTLKKVIDECPDDQDDEQKEKQQIIKIKVKYTDILLKKKKKLIGIP